MKERMKTNSVNMVSGQGRMGMKGGTGRMDGHGFQGQTAPNTLVYRCSWESSIGPYYIL